MSESTERWFAFASEDLQMAEFAPASKALQPSLFSLAAMRRETLKALLVGLGSSIPRTHSITDLLGKLPNSWFADIREDMVMLDDFYIPARYPDALPGTLPDGLPGQEDATQALALAQAVMEEARRLLQTPL